MLETSLIVYVYVCVWILVCVHNIILCFKIEIVCMCVHNFTKIIIKNMEFNR
jgi:hypothetical protein